jgi:sterol desaturase/sphingolipid hydroxylase (fatty acid hydroxylase superfamily)
MKQRLTGLIPPATLLAVLLFWAYAPKSVVDYPWTLTIAATLVSAWLLLLEWLFERHADWRMNWREFWTDSFYVVVSSTLISRANDFFADAPMKALKASAGLSTPWLEHLPFLAQVGLIFFLFELGQYWMHRGMHNWTPLWLTHAPHHHITQLNALKGYVGNPLELFLISLGVIALLDFSPVAVLCAANVGNVVAGFAHANVRADPPRFYSFFFTTIRHHSLHHSVDYESTRCNYANSLILIDRVLGTFREGESKLVGQDERRRLSIKEQWMFPFVPVIDAWRARRTSRAPANN